MKCALIRASLMLAGIILFCPTKAQSNCYRLYKFSSGIINGFQEICIDSIPEKPLESIEKAIRRNLFENEKPIAYINNSKEDYCISFIDKHYELNYLIIDKTGRVVHSIIFINPEFAAFSAINNQMSELGYYFQIIDSPFGPVQKNISPSKTWFEAYPGKQGNDEFETILIFDDHFQLIATERGD